MLAESWARLFFVLAWSFTVVCLHEIGGYTWLVMPVLPVTLIGIAVSLYTGFKSVSAYNRWWEARTALGGIATRSREWVTQVHSLIYNDTDSAPAAVVRELIYRHLAWVYAVAHMLRRTSRLKISEHTRLFEHRRVGYGTATSHEDPESYGRFLNAEEFAAAKAFRSPASYLMRRQGETLRELARSGYLDSVRQSEMTFLLGRMNENQGTCERIKHTPFPRQIAHFGTVFTWLFVILLPLAFLDVFEREVEHHNFSTILGHEYMFSLIPFAALLSWVFLMMEKISDSTEDPFEGGVNGVPISALCRTTEIDLKQALGERDIPPLLEPLDDVLY